MTLDEDVHRVQNERHATVGEMRKFSGHKYFLAVITLYFIETSPCGAQLVLSMVLDS